MWWSLWLIWTTVIVSVTTLPWSNYVGHSHWSSVRWILFHDHPLALLDIVANVALFFPLGFFFTRALRNGSLRTRSLLTLISALVLSGSVEYFQVYCHNRIPSTTDILTNVLGAGLGAILAGPKEGRKNA